MQAHLPDTLIIQRRLKVEDLVLWPMPRPLFCLNNMKAHLLAELKICYRMWGKRNAGSLKLDPNTRVYS